MLVAQAPTPQQLQQLQRDPERLRQMIRQSGLTSEQVRSRLAGLGYSPTLLDQFLDPAPRGAPVLEIDQQMLAALGVLGLDTMMVEGIEPVPVVVGPQPVDTTTAPEAREVGLRLFGLDVFRRTTTQFQPILAGPVPPNYRLGPGDRMVLVLTGDVEIIHTLQVTREGFIVVPQVGQLSVANLTMEQLGRLLRQRLARSYSGIRTGTTRFEVTITRLRTNQIFVTGEVAQPGAYQLSSVATVLNALYAAGGLTERANPPLLARKYYSYSAPPTYPSFSRCRMIC